LEQGIRLQIKLSKDAYKNFTGVEIKEPFGFMPKDEFEKKHNEFKRSSYNFQAIESAVGIVSRFNEQELQAFVKIIGEETDYELRYSHKEE
jgi:hypothetical protein